MSFKLFMYYCALSGGWACFLVWAVIGLFRRDFPGLRHPDFLAFVGRRPFILSAVLYAGGSIPDPPASAALFPNAARAGCR